MPCAPGVTAGALRLAGPDASSIRSRGVFMSEPAESIDDWRLSDPCRVAALGDDGPTVGRTVGS